MYGRGLRRRLPTMLKGDPARIRMVYSLMFSLPGTPVLFYGEEIGMGEDLSAKGRSAVRSPMQWNDTENGGFSPPPRRTSWHRSWTATSGRRTSTRPRRRGMRSRCGTSWPPSSSATGRAPNWDGATSNSSSTLPRKCCCTSVPGPAPRWSWPTISGRSQPRWPRAWPGRGSEGRVRGRFPAGPAGRRGYWAGGRRRIRTGAGPLRLPLVPGPESG